MKRASLILILLSFFPLVFLPGDVSGGPCSNSLAPPFIAAGVKPNILILLDNSLSFDEDFVGNAVGSYSPASKSVVARQTLQSLVNDLQSKANVGVMTFTLPSDVQSFYVHNAFPFASYNPKSYCANPPQDCVTYCTSEDSTAKSNCEAACPGLTTTTYYHSTTDTVGTKFPDLIVTHYLTNDPIRARYCGVIYPKTYMATLNGENVYYNTPDPFYDGSDDGTMFGYSGSDAGSQYAYNPADNASYTYAYFSTKTGTSDTYAGYSGYIRDYSFQPTDSDWALGFFNWGQSYPWYYVGPTWFSQSAPPSPQGCLHVPVGDLTNTTQFNDVYNILNPNADTTGAGTAYMSCTQWNKNQCPYIINSANTPTAGALQSALNYFNGTYSYSGTSSPSPINSACQKNFIIFITDGLPSVSLNGTPTSDPSILMPEVITQLNNLQTNVIQTVGGKQYTFPVKTYVLGMGLSTKAKANLDQMAVAGGTVQTSGHAYYADNPSQFLDALETIITDLLGRVAAGSAISILSEGQTQMGDNMLQGVFYPTKYFGTTTMNWPGYLYDYWFYNSSISYCFNSSGASNGVPCSTAATCTAPYNSTCQNYNNIREDTVHDYIFELNLDYGLVFSFDSQLGLSVNRYSDPSGSGNPTTFVDNVGLDSLTPTWEAGNLLFQATAAGRQIYTPGSSTSGLVSFDTSNTTLIPTSGSSPLGTPSTFDSCLQGSSGTATLQNLVNYVRGTDRTNCRNRTVGLCSNGTAFNNNPCGSNSDCTTGSYTTCTKNVWKLGDIVYSSPQVQTDYKYCSSGTSFNSTSCSQNSDCTSGTYTSCQKKESVIYVGANDGMLHAFKTGILTTSGMDATQYQVAAMTGIPTSDMGKELWAFIPKNSLPYLRCLAVPPPSSCHLYYNDLSPYITTMVSNGVTKTVLIGGMRLGGGTMVSPGTYCFNSSGASNGQTCTQNSNCTTSPYNSGCSSAYLINAPSDTCSSTSLSSSTTTFCSSPATCYNPSNCTGLSSYYALDITDAENPKLLWEFSHPFLGYTYSGPAVIHKWSDATHLSGDQYYVMFLSGPTNPTDGSSILNVQAFILTLNANLGISSLYYKDFGSTTKNGFGGRLFTPGLDVNNDGYTDFVFFGYASSPSGTSTDWQGGIAKINTNNTDASAAMNPQNWTYDISTYSSIATQPITSRVVAEQCFNTWYLYGGTGRYFFPQDNYGGTGNAGLNYIMGLPFTCDQYNNNCAGITSLNNSAAACAGLQQGTFGQAGWQYNLNGTAGSYLNERMITDPTISTGNKIYLTTSEPTSDPCGYGGQSRVWGLNCATGGAIADASCTGYVVTDLSGTLYLQTSTGAIYRIGAASGFTDAGTGYRTTPWFVGMPPENAPTVVQPAAQAARAPGQVIQWIEK